jgi:hypothetical protein
MKLDLHPMWRWYLKNSQLTRNIGTLWTWETNWHNLFSIIFFKWHLRYIFQQILWFFASKISISFYFLLGENNKFNKYLLNLENFLKVFVSQRIEKKPWTFPMFDNFNNIFYYNFMYMSHKNQPTLYGILVFFFC